MKASRPGALLLDGGDTWQGTATALWTNGAGHGRRLQAAGRGRDDRPLGVHLRHGAGARRSSRRTSPAQVDFVAQNVKTNDFGDPVFKPYVIREINGVPVAIVGQAFPYTPIANPRYMVADWSFGIQDDNMQKMVDEARAKGAQAGGGARHNGMDVDLKMASRVTRHRRHLRRPHARRRAGGGAGEERRRHDPGHQRRQQRQVPRRDGLRGQGRQGRAAGATGCCRCSATCCTADPAMDALITKVRAPVRSQAGREAGRHRRPAVPARQLQRQLGPAAVRRADGRAGRRDRVFARVSAGAPACCPATPSRAS